MVDGLVRPLLPAAATISVPAAEARCAAVSNTVEGSAPTATAAPSDIETTAQPLATAQSMPPRMCASAPEPALLSTLPAKISAPEAMP